MNEEEKVFYYDDERRRRLLASDIYNVDATMCIFPITVIKRGRESRKDIMYLNKIIYIRQVFFSNDFETSIHSKFLSSSRWLLGHHHHCVSFFLSISSLSWWPWWFPLILLLKNPQKQTRTSPKEYLFILELNANKQLSENDTHRSST